MRSITFIFCLCFLAHVHGQIESPFNYGASALGQGNAFTARMNHSAIYYNPAGIVSLNSSSVSANFAQLYNNIGIYHFNVAGILHSNFGNFGIRVQNYGDEGYNFQNYSLIYGRKILDKLHMALGFNLFQFKIDQYGNQFIPNIEFGILSEISKNLFIGAHIANPLPLEIGDENNFPTILSIGISYNLGEKVILSADIEKNIYIRENIKIGIEYKIHPILSLRTGINTFPATYHFGLGLVLKNLQIDLGNQVHQVLGNTTGLGVQYLIDNKK